MTDDILTPQQVADWLQVTPATLKRWRYNRTGPLALHLGPQKVRYRRSDVDTWLTRCAQTAANQRTTLRGIA